MNSTSSRDDGVAFGVVASRVVGRSAMLARAAAVGVVAFGVVALRVVGRSAMLVRAAAVSWMVLAGRWRVLSLAVFKLGTVGAL